MKKKEHKGNKQMMAKKHKGSTNKSRQRKRKEKK